MDGGREGVVVGGGRGGRRRRGGKKTTWWNSAISSEPICKISLWKSNSYYVFISTSAYLLNEEETDQTGRESLQEPITANGSQLSARSDAPSHCAFSPEKKKKKKTRRKGEEEGRQRKASDTERGQRGGRVEVGSRRTAQASFFLLLRSFSELWCRASCCVLQFITSCLQASHFLHGCLPAGAPLSFLPALMLAVTFLHLWRPDRHQATPQQKWQFWSNLITFFHHC